jgi:hypothetical protein
VITYVKIKVQTTPRAEENLRADRDCGNERGKKMKRVKMVIHENLPV